MGVLSDDDVRYVAGLSKFVLSDEELQRFKVELSAILGYVQQLQAINTDGVEPTAQVSGLTNVMRKDEIAKDQVSQQELLKNVPRKTKVGYIEVEKVL